MEILRREYKDLKNVEGWMLIYGRRKVGKSFLIRKYVNHDLYYVITRDLQAYFPSDGSFRKLDEAFVQSIKALREGKTVVIDEFQRLPEKYWDGLSAEHPNGKLILVGSSFRVMKKLVDKRSPLLGLVLPYKLDIIHYADVLSQVKDPLLSLIYRDPWSINFVKGLKDLEEKAYQLYMVTKALIGEIFEEEERQLTMLYEAVLLSLAEGEWNTPIISGALNSKGFNVTPSTVSGILDTLVNMGLVEKIKIYGDRRRARWYYRISSPIISLMFYAEAKYNVSFTETLGELPIGREVQFSIGEMMAEYKNLTFAYSPYEDIDVVLLNNDKPVIGYEVKLGRFSKSEGEKSVERIRRAGIPKAGLISLTEKPNFSLADEVLGPEDLVKIAEYVFKKYVE
ncbi:ATP-binding protein [Sulfolobus sp. SCGC AB-777_G05]|nr:ATP-binding protein [Sulfolobus sp. SCGC AB-777_G05]PVU68146.1 ATP-binding protein [Sulfolobus sp. SCGC AB-777_G05]